jgi:hypothetical protein
VLWGCFNNWSGILNIIRRQSTVTFTFPAGLRNGIGSMSVPSKIIIKGADLSASIEITDPKTLANFFVWTGTGTSCTGACKITPVDCTAIGCDQSTMKLSVLGVESSVRELHPLKSSAFHGALLRQLLARLCFRCGGNIFHSPTKRSCIADLAALMNAASLLPTSS